MKRNYWPLLFIGIFSFTFAMIIWTIMSAVKVPVNKEDSFLSTYHSIDMDFNNIVLSNKKFLSKYDIEFDFNSNKIPLEIDDIYYGQRTIELKSKHKNMLKSGKNIIKVNIKDKNSNIIKDAVIQLRVNIPTNHNFDIDLKEFNHINNEFINEFEIPHSGNWNVTGTVEVNGDKGYLYIKTDATK